MLYNENMKTGTSVLAAIFSLLLFSSPSFAVEKKCSFCHAGHSGSAELLKKDINELCKGCHAERIAKGEHRVGMSPPMPVKGLPLYNGYMSCITCHDPHSKSVFMLRKPTKELCISCHNK